MARKELLGTAMLAVSELDHIDLRDFAQNIFVTGVIGGGKTSGPGFNILKALLLSGAGGIVMCNKPGEADEVFALCKKLKRQDAVIRWSGNTHGFNFLAYALSRLGADGINGVVEYIMRVIEMVRAASPLQGGNGDAFWMDELRVLLRYAAWVVYLATGTLRIADIIAFVRSAPTSPEQWQDEAWHRARPFFLECFAEAAPKLDDITGERIVAYWKDDFAKLDARLRSNILAGFSMLDRFNHGWLREALCGDTSLVPELCFQGAIIILDMPRATYGEDGVIAQMIFKDAWQTAVLARNALAPEYRERFVFCYADECQEVVTAGDANFLSLSRSSRATTIYLTQSLPSMYSKIGGQNAHDRTHHLIAGFGHRIFCANHCTETNKWAAETLGRTLHQRGNASESYGTSSNWSQSMNEGRNWGSSHGSGGGSSTDAKGMTGTSSSWNSGSSRGSSDGYGLTRGHGTSSTASRGYSEAMDYAMEPGAFARLKSGGPAHDFRVSAVWFAATKQFAASGGSNALLVEFRQ